MKCNGYAVDLVLLVLVFHVYHKFDASDVCDTYVSPYTLYVFGVLDEFGDALDAGNTSYCISKRILFDL